MWRLVRGQPWDVIAAVAVGGALGAAARHGIELAWPTPQHAFPWAVFAINTTGSALIGVLMVLTIDMRAGHRLVRPMLGTGVLGGFTTFSAYAVDIERLLTAGALRTGLLYLVATPVAALTAVWAATLITRAAIRGARP